MILYELVTLHLTFAGAADAPAAAVRFVTEPDAGGQLLGCWRSEIGAVNKIVLLRSFGSAQEMLDERVRARRSADPFYGAGGVSEVELQGFVPIAGYDAVAPGRYGNFYEIRSYKVRPGGLARLIPEWEVAGPERDAVSKLLLVMYSIEGEDRLVHIWPYDTLEQRMSARAAAPQECSTWPTPSGIESFDASDMRSGIFYPTAESPLN